MLVISHATSRFILDVLDLKINTWSKGLISIRITNDNRDFCMRSKLVMSHTIKRLNANALGLPNNLFVDYT